MRRPELSFIVPGPIGQRTGGYLYDAKVVEGLRSLGWTVRVHSLRGRFPSGDQQGREDLGTALAALSDGATVVIDGLAMGGLPEPVQAHRSRLRIVGLVHHPLADETGLARGERDRLFWSERHALESCLGIVVTSAYTKRRLARYGIGPEHIRVVIPGTESAPSSIGPGSGCPPRLLCVASVTPRKGHDILVDALERLRDLAWTCVCAGSLDRDAAFADRVAGTATERGLGDRITFAGELESTRLEELYRTSSVFVLASRFEGYGMALAEALAHGLPVVSTTGGAIPDTVPADAGLLVPPGDPERLAGALRRVLADLPDGTSSGSAGRSLRDMLTRGALRYAASLPDWGDTARRFAGAVLDLTSNGVPTRGDAGSSRSRAGS